MKFMIWKRNIFYKVKGINGLREAHSFAAQGSPQIDAEIAKNSRSGQKLNRHNEQNPASLRSREKYYRDRSLWNLLISSLCPPTAKNPDTFFSTNLSKVFQDIFDKLGAAFSVAGAPPAILERNSQPPERCSINSQGGLGQKRGKKYAIHYYLLNNNNIINIYNKSIQCR